MNNFLIYRASAGTGKTFSLVKEYLTAILQKPDDFKHTLAITFTNKASEEMKSRILLHLSNIANGHDETEQETWQGMVPALILSTGFSEETLIEKAKTVLNNILHNYSSFKVSTIDSFAHVVVQTFAREMQLPINFELKLESDSIIMEAVDLLLSQVNGDESDPAITKILIDFTKKNIENNRNADVTADLYYFAEKMLGEDGIMQRSKLAQFDLKDLQQKEQEIKKALNAYSIQIKNLALPVWEKISHLEGSFYQGTRGGISSFFKNLTINPLCFPLTTYSQKTIEEDKWFSGKCSDVEKREIEALKPFIENAYLDIAALQKDNKSKIILFELIWKKLHSIMLLNEINRIVTQLRNESGIVHISEMNKRIANIIEKEPIPFIYERIGERYKNYLIDEFQDTSTLQWKNFVPLIANSLSENGLSMIVGDGKQAIYRWRSGDVEQFEQLSTLKTHSPKNESEAIFQHHLNLQVLSQNFRSDKQIVDFTNKLFEFAKQYIPTDYKDLRNVYSDLKLNYLPEKDDGFVGVQFVAETEDVSYEKMMCKSILDTINQLIFSKFSYSDIAILCRVNQDSSLVAQYLIEHGIPVASSDSLKLTASKKVRLLCAALHYFAVPNPSNRAIFWLLLWRTQNLKWSDEIMTQINAISEDQFRIFLKNNGFNIDFQNITELTLIDAATTLMENLKISPVDDLHLRFFLDELLDAQNKDVSAITDFPEWWMENGKKLSLSIPESSDSVKIMTIHKAKGLGFPVVIYPFADNDFKKSIDDIWLDLNEDEYFLPAALVPINKVLQETCFSDIYNEEMAKSALDLLNVFYVACTRPKKELYILSKKKEKYDGNAMSIPNILHDFLVSENRWNDEKTEYSFGTQTEQIRKSDEEQSETQSNSNISLIPWQKRLSIHGQDRFFWTSEETERGTMIHNILENVKTEASIPEVIEKLQSSGIVSIDESQKIFEMLQKIVLHPELSPFFDDKNEILCESSILLPENREFRPDRIVITGEKVRILDYKTGKPKPEHAVQVKAYMETLEKMGYEIETGTLAYISLPAKKLIEEKITIEIVSVE